MACVVGGVIAIIVGVIIMAGFVYLWWWLDNKRDESKPKIGGWAKFGMFLGIFAGLSTVTSGINAMDKN